MSKIGSRKIIVHNSIKTMFFNNTLIVKGHYGCLFLEINKNIGLLTEKHSIRVFVKTNSNKCNQIRGLTRSLVYNTLYGVTNNFNVSMQLHGTGYRAHTQHKILFLNIGYSHNIAYIIPNNIDISCHKGNEIIISGCNKTLVGQTAADLYMLRKPESYKGKGVRYKKQKLKLKESKKK